MKNLRTIFFIASGVTVFFGLLMNSFYTILLGIAILIAGLKIQGPQDEMIEGYTPAPEPEPPVEEKKTEAKQKSSSQKSGQSGGSNKGSRKKRKGKNKRR